jgi:hypothetical protein
MEIEADHAGFLSGVLPIKTGMAGPATEKKPPRGFMDPMFPADAGASIVYAMAAPNN